MPNQTRIVVPGPDARSVRTADGQVLHAPAEWILVPPGDPGLTRRVKAAGPTWTVQESVDAKPSREASGLLARQSRRSSHNLPPSARRPNTPSAAKAMRGGAPASNRTTWKPSPGRCSSSWRFTSATPPSPARWRSRWRSTPPPSAAAPSPAPAASRRGARRSRRHRLAAPSHHRVRPNDHPPRKRKTARGAAHARGKITSPPRCVPRGARGQCGGVPAAAGAGFQFDRYDMNAANRGPRRLDYENPKMDCRASATGAKLVDRAHRHPDRMRHCRVYLSLSLSNYENRNEARHSIRPRDRTKSAVPMAILNRLSLSNRTLGQHQAPAGARLELSFNC